VLAVAVAFVGLQACKPACGVGSTVASSDGSSKLLRLTRANESSVARPKPKPKPKKPCPPGSGTSNKKKMRGANGTQVTSKTVANGAVGQYKYRIDVENPAPGRRAGSLHVQLGGRGSTHYEYGKGGKFFARDGTPLPRQVQREIDRSPKAQAGIKEALRILGGK
jgi:hypothetical protein